MTETPARKPRPRRTFSTFGDVRKMPSEYEIVTHAQNWTLRHNRAATFEQNPSSAPNLWFLTYRENSPLQAENWDAYRDPDALTYKAYVNLQAEAEAKVHGVLEAHAEAGADASPGREIGGAARPPVHPVALSVSRVPAGRGLHRVHGPELLHHERGRLLDGGLPAPRDDDRLSHEGAADRQPRLGHRLGRALAVGNGTTAGSRPARRSSTRWSATTGARRSPRSTWSWARPWMTCCSPSLARSPGATRTT